MDRIIKRHWALPLLIGLLLLQSNAYAQTKDQFDLICNGTTTSTETTLAGVREAQKPWSLHLSVDLAAGQFCFLGCKAASSIARIEPDTIVFKDEPPSAGFDKNELSVSRSDGSVHRMMYSRSGGFLDNAKGTCTVAPFTSFPKTMF